MPPSDPLASRSETTLLALTALVLFVDIEFALAYLLSFAARLLA